MLTGEERRISFFDDFHFCRSRVTGLDSNNSGTAKVKIVKNESDPPLFTSKQLIRI
jgi:hypothetical protein